MTAFVLVPGMFTGGHVWQETAAHLTAAGAEVHPVTPTGLDGAGGTPGADLETHIADVVAAIDAAGAAQGRRVVLVGHDYGIHPAVGAADRRAGHVARIVYLDAAMPRDGVSALASVTDEALRAQVTGRARAEGGDGALAPPAGRAQWQRWGSTAGVDDTELDRLTALAAPHPLGTLLQPLRLTGAVAAVPTTGVLCTGNGVSIELVQRLVDFGDPALQILAAPEVTFFELATGHWPMLSRPAELAEVLLRAAAGQGHRLIPAGRGEPPAHLRPFPLEVPEVPVDRRGHVDLHLPTDAEGPLPAVLFVHGGPVPAGARPTPREWPGQVGYARSAAARGVVGVTFDHRLHDTADYARAADDVAAAVEVVRSDPRVDADRVALWFFSGGGLLSADWLGAPPAWLRCVAASYPVLAPMPNWGMADSRFRPAVAVGGAGALPVVLVRAGRESPEIAATVEDFLAAAEGRGTDVEVVDVPGGRHGFESADAPDEWREPFHHALDRVVTHLTA
ncbi:MULTISPECIES: S9 family peptidase [unclassified Streptomyces]|uniref:alpha/beta hydrolase family protein n=1 Tax=unclassified Streptomyces TaxID=2593676 RepID=UPI001F039049|nr:MULTISPECIES: alpha/beta fold hydrolase [unclassified Streptomyces]MCH0562383.1 alpha/beta fold hydrolase [Streptomyces sp. MUM 2J]MCH0570529.1 alpha/beta fold hydrolase [Streptomyces sp. MUM 136J]